jgi:8-oxo-dGTP diphosphatase
MSLPVKTATMCYFRRADDIWVMDYRKHNHPLHAGKFAPPGGKRNDEETLEECIIREVFEETGMKISSVKLRGQVLFFNERRTFGGKPAKNDWQVYVYECYNFDESKARPTEGKFVRIKKEEIESIPMHEGDRKILDWLLQNKGGIFNARIEHVGEQLASAVFDKMD